MAFLGECAEYRLKVQSPRLAHALKETGLCKALDAFSFPATLTNSKDRFVYVNRAFTVRYGFSETEILGLSPTILVPNDFPEGKLKALKKNIATRPAGWEGVLINQTRSQERIVVYLRTVALRPQRHLPNLFYLGFSALPEEIKKAEAELISLLSAALLMRRPEGRISKADPEKTRQREVCQLRDLGYSTKEIAAIMGITVSTVNVVTWRARRRAAQTKQ